MARSSKRASRSAAAAPNPEPRQAARRPRSLVGVSRRLRERVDGLNFSDPVAAVYNPLDYARLPHERYLRRYGAGPKRYVLLGMNPGPYGMAQTGVPFGEVAFTRDFLGIRGKVRTPSKEHPKRPITGFDCPRSEVSGRRLWGFVQACFGEAEHFFAEAFVLNYCPLVFMDEGGRNLTPDKLRADERPPLFAACDAALEDSLRLLAPELVIGVGRFGEDCAKRVLDAAVSAGRIDEAARPKVGRILHPSPASPAANRGWAAAAHKQLRALGLSLPDL